jgi:hypothetical protein
MTTGIGEDPFVEGEGVDIVFIVDNSHDSMATEKLVEDGPRDMVAPPIFSSHGRGAVPSCPSTAVGLTGIVAWAQASAQRDR